MKNKGLIGVFILAALMLIGCQSATPTPTPTRMPIQLETKKPHIRGQVTNVTIRDSKVVGILIEGVIEADTRYDIARVAINSETHIYVKSDGILSEADSSLLEKGQTVEALFTFPVNESYPVQAYAIEIVILK